MPQAYGSGIFQVRPSELFADPFSTQADSSSPDNRRDVLRWAEYLTTHVSMMREAMDRVLAYFITEVEIIGDDIDTAVKKKWKDFLYDTIGIEALLMICGRDSLTYNNGFTHAHIKFRRYLTCPKCGFTVPVREAKANPLFQFEYRNFEFVLSCPNSNCNGMRPYRGPFNRFEKRGNAETDMRIIRRNPHDMEILYDSTTHETEYIWRLDEDVRADVRGGVALALDNTPWEVVEAVKKNQYLRFGKDVLYHMKEEALSGVRNRGWGIPRILGSFADVWYVQLLRRYNEVLATDYVVPLRVIVPDSRPGGGGNPIASDPFFGSDLGQFRSRVEGMIRSWRRDPAQWFVSPFPMRAVTMGGEATKLAPKDLLDQGYDTLLNGMGVPVNIYKMDLTTTAAPPALRVFAAFWAPFVRQLNRFLNYVIKEASELLDWEPVTGRLMKPSLADDVQMQANLLQLMLNGQISQTSGLRAVGRDFADEQKQILEDQQFVAQETQKAQEQMAKQQQMGQIGQAQGGDNGSSGGGAGGILSGDAPQPNQPTTLQELGAKAQEAAQQISAMPDGQRKSELLQLQKTNPQMAAMVSQEVRRIREQQNVQGGDQLRQQQQQQMGKQAAEVPRLWLPPGLLVRGR